MKTVYLHIGAPKTGTTTIQNFCRANQAALAARDVWFPVHLRNHHILLYDVIGQPDATPNSFDALLTEFACSRFSRLLISAESFFLRAARMNAQRLPASLSKFRLVVICYVRRSDEYMTSLYQTNVRGLARSTQSALEFVRERPPGYAMRLSRIDELFQPGEFIVGSYDAVKGNLLRDFFSIVGVTDAGLCGSFPTRHVNARLSARQILFLRRLNELRIDQRLFARIGRILQAKPDTDQSHLLPAACRRRLVVQFNTEIDALNRKFGCALHPMPVPCDDQQEMSDLTCEDIASVMNSLREHMDGRAMLKLARPIHDLGALRDAQRVGVRDRGVFFTAAGAGIVERAGGWRDVVCRGVLAPWSWSGGLQGDGDRAEQFGFGTGGGEGQPDARDGFDDAGPELEELEPEGGELGAGEVMGLGHRIAHGKHQPVGGGVEHEADLVGDR